jgi:hypothetical protein
MDVLQEYARITGVDITKVPREEAINNITTLLPDWSPLDQLLLNEVDVLPDDHPLAMWLRGNRKPLGFTGELSVTGRQVFVANPAWDRQTGDPERMVALCIAGELTPAKAVELLRNSGHSLNEVMDAFRAANYVVSMSFVGDVETINASYAVLRISNQPSTKIGWKRWAWWIRETADVHLGDAVEWILPFEQIMALELPIIRVLIVDVEVGELTKIVDDDQFE